MNAEAEHLIRQLAEHGMSISPLTAKEEATVRKLTELGQPMTLPAPGQKQGNWGVILNPRERD
jgi:hypothetical protein